MSDELSENNLCSRGAMRHEQYAAMKRAQTLGDFLMEENMDVLLEMARDVDLSYRDVAEALLPDVFANYPEVASKAVGYAIRQVIQPDEVRELTYERRSLRKKEQIKSMGEVAFLAHQRAAANKSWENRDAPNMEAMLKGRGQTAWSDEEKNKLIELIQDPSYNHVGGGNRNGRPNYKLIAVELNSLFHDGEEVRYSNSVGSMKRDFSRGKAKTK